MKKTLISILAISAMVSSIGASALAATEIKFTDPNGDAVTAVPDIGEVKATADGANFVLFAEYDKDDNLIRVNTNSMSNINDFDDSTYVKTFAWSSADTIAPITESEIIGKSEDKQLLVSYANGFTEKEQQNKPKIQNSNPDYTYGSAKYSAQRTKVYEDGEALPSGLDLTKYDTVKIRYYAGDKDTDRFLFCLMSNEKYGTYNSLTKRYLYYLVKPTQVGWNVATIKLKAMSNNNTTNDPNTDEDDTVALPIASATHWGLMTDQGEKLFGSDDAVPKVDGEKSYNNSLYIDSIWFEDNSNVIDFSLDDTWTIIGTLPQFSKDTTVGYGTKTQSAKVTGVHTNKTGYLNLSNIGFKTDWSEYKTINIRYRTSNTEYVPPVRLSTIQDWVASEQSTTADAYKPKSGLYTSKRATTANEWTVVSYDLKNDLKARHNNGTLPWTNVPYLQIPTSNLIEIWNKDSSVTYQAWNGTDQIYIDSIWLAK